MHCDAVAWDNLVMGRAPNLTAERIKDGDETLTVVRTPVGEFRSRRGWGERARSGYPVEYPLKGPEDYKVAM